MDSQGGKTMEMPALGRPFTLGMLYDCREDKLVPGITLWDIDDLKKDTREQLKPNSEFEIVASESIDDKSSALNVEASLKASFLGGLIEVEGSAKYLNDQKTSRHQARVTLKYNSTTKFQELTMNHLGRGNVRHPYVFEKGVATHVVTGILYGAQAFFVFDREMSKTENQQEVQGNLKVMVKKIPLFSIEGQGALRMDEKEKSNVENLSCKFHGDFYLENCPVSFTDAIDVYKSLPKRLGPNGENAVPLKVWLLPLATLDSSAAKLVCDISIRLVNEAQSILEDFSDLEMRCNDALKTSTVQNFPQIGKKIKYFKGFCAEFKLDFQKLLAKKLPAIRGGGEGEAELVDILKKRTSTPFNSDDLSEWMDNKEREMCVLKSYTEMLQNTKIVSSHSEIHQEILSTDYAVCFVFTSLGIKDSYLTYLEKYLKDSHNSRGLYDLEKEQWYLTKDVANALRHKAKLFSDFVDANKGNKNITFLTMGMTDEKHPGSSIYLYKDGVCENENFEPTSKPDKITVSDTDFSTVTLTISPPKYGSGSITSYCVEFNISGDNEWLENTEVTGAEEVVVSGLVPNTEYRLRCRAKTPVGLSPVYDVDSPIKTLPCSAPGKPQIEMTSSEMSVSWKKPCQVGEDVHILGYVIEYAHIVNDEDLQWNQKLSGSEKVVISGLQPESKYAVRVQCDCGVSGKSKESDTVYVNTTRREFTRLAEYFKHISKEITSESFPSLYKLPLKEEDIDIDGCCMYNLGKESTRQNRTIMLLGATGSGKSTLINGIINYVAGVEWKDNYRFKLVHEDTSKSQAESQTSVVSVYKLNYQEGFTVPFSLTVVDTPGFGDTSGIERDKEITEQIRKIFTSANGVSKIDAICFVTQASLPRLTATQRYVFDSVLSIFGKDVAENILMLVTFADGKQPPVLEAINAAGVPCPKNDLGLPVHYKFNNSVLFANNRGNGGPGDSDDNFDEMFWRMGTKSMQKFFTALTKMETKSLLMTKEVLKERKQLETAVEGLQPQVIAGLAKLQEIKTTKEKIKEHETVMTSNENYKIEVEVMKPVKVQLTNKGEYITNCQACQITCHYPCGIKEDSRKDGCTAMDLTGKCTVCPEKCPWITHFNQTYRWDYVKEKQTLTVQEMKEKYARATNEKLTIQEVIERQEEEIENLQDVIMSLIDQSAQCLTRLKEIALRPNPLSAPEYIDVLIEGERSEAKPGYETRIQALEAMRDKAKIISRVAKKDRLKKLQNSHEEPCEEQQQEQGEKPGKGLLKKIGNFFGLG